MAQANSDGGRFKPLRRHARWPRVHEVQLLAKENLAQQVRSIQSYGSYSSRNIIANAAWRDVRSQHDIANAADIGGVHTDRRTVHRRS